MSTPLAADYIAWSSYLYAAKKPARFAFNFIFNKLFAMRYLVLAMFVLNISYFLVAQEFSMLPNFRIPGLLTFSGTHFFGGINPNWYRSVDGQNWEKLATFSAPGVIRILEANDDTLFVRTLNGPVGYDIFSSFDAGRTWQKRFTSDSFYWNSEIARVVYSNGKIFTEMLSSDGRFLMSPDLGTTWIPIDGINNTYGRIIESNGVVLLVNSFGIYQYSFSTNRFELRKDLSGLELDFLNAIFENGELFVFLHDQNAGGTVLAYKVEISNFELIPMNLTTNLKDISLCGMTYFAIDINSAYYQSNDGITWAEIIDPALKYHEIGNGVFMRDGSRSLDCGLTWNAGTYGMPVSRPDRIDAYLGITDSAIYVASWPTILKAKSLDDKWSVIDSQVFPNSESFIASDVKTVAIITKNNDVYELSSQLDSVVWKSKLPNYVYDVNMLDGQLFYIEGGTGQFIVKYSQDFGGTINDIPQLSMPTSLCKSLNRVFVLENFQDIYEINPITPGAVSFLTQAPAPVNKIVCSRTGIIFAVGNDKVFRFGSGNWTDISDQIVPFTGSLLNVECLNGKDTLFSTFYTFTPLQQPVFSNFYSYDAGVTWISLPQNSTLTNAKSHLAGWVFGKEALFSLDGNFISMYRSLGSTQTIDLAENKEMLDIWPNPTKGRFLFRQLEAARGYLSIVDQFGREVWFENLSDTKNNIHEVSCDLSPGYYTVSFYSETGVSCSKLVVMR